MKQDTKKLFIFLAICWLFINALWGFLITELSKESSIESTSTVQSKLKGCFVEELAITPNLIEVNGEKAQIREIWLEKRHDLWFLLSFIPGILDYSICTQKKGFQIVLTFEKGKDHDFLDRWFFVLEGEGKITIGDETEEIKSGHLIYVPRNSVHTTEATKGTLTYLCMNGLSEEAEDIDFETMYNRVSQDRIDRWKNGSSEIGE